MQDNTSIQFARDHEPPSKSPNTKMIAAALTSGAEFASNKAFLDTVEEVDGQPRRTVTWLMNGQKTIEFAPIATKEEISFAEFMRRFHSAEWCEENADHPIAYMRGFAEMLNRLRDKIKTMKPMVLIRRGKKLAVIPADCDAARKARILAHF